MKMAMERAKRTDRAKGKGHRAQSGAIGGNAVLGQGIYSNIKERMSDAKVTEDKG